MSKWLNNKKRIWSIKTVPKPCHKLKFCPYGCLVEEYPCHNEAEKYAIRHNKFVKMIKGKGWVECKRTERGATSLNRNFIGFEINPGYVEIVNKRLEQNILKTEGAIPPMSKDKGILAQFL